MRDSPPSETDRSRGGFRLGYITIPLLLLLAIVLVLEVIPANYYVLAPGDALSVAPMISIRNRPPVHTRGRLLLTDVRLVRVNHLLEELWWKLDPNAEIQPVKDVSGGLSDSEYSRLSVRMMDESIQTAEAAALNATPGYHVRCSRNGPRIVLIMPKTPAARILRVGDSIRSVSGHRTRCASQIRPLVRRLAPGHSVSMTILRNGKVKQVRVRTISSESGRTKRAGHALIGIFMRDQFTFPIKIRIRPGNISGSSAGLMFALGIVERLEHEDLTRGCKVAGTGTIDYQGNVGAIGGAKQKVVAARNAGASYFLVPTDRADRSGAMSAKGSLTVLAVKTLHQALNDLRRLKSCR